MSDILERLAAATDDVDGGRHEHGIGHYWNLCEEAEDEIRALRKRVEELEVINDALNSAQTNNLEMIDFLGKRVEELERGEVRWGVMLEDGALVNVQKRRLLEPTNMEELDWRIVRVRVTEIPEEEADE